MLNECLKKDASQNVEILDYKVQIGETGIPAEDSLNLGPRRIAKQRVQRMRRRHDRALSTGYSRLGWAARMM